MDELQIATFNVFVIEMTWMKAIGEYTSEGTLGCLVIGGQIWDEMTITPSIVVEIKRVRRKNVRRFWTFLHLYRIR